ncbi:uncharacterized protein ARMOST_07650 [Armillaria ostoyae]|uniref:Stalled ribosome sensor GCN1-like HEAT repeats region domain-containing protein n=1 Tax=Armillaria ostoyae TaxID=47428 RepID=A0A284R6H5_ARMOS|nr:uncharacterized protein ARMOST_07650 [Armillaria ostoyae]
MHYIDHSSLALDEAYASVARIMADTKKKAAQIVGNLASLTDLRDFVPYLSELLPMVRIVLVDPVPEARATSANVLGTLVECLGEGHFPDLVPGLLRILKTDTSGVDQQGAAQGLIEVLSGLGMELLEGLLPDIIANAQSPRATVREGFMSLLVYLSATFGTRFQPHLPKIITPILSGIFDVEQYVLDATMRAGRMIIINYSNRAIDLLLPEPERGTFDPGGAFGELMFKVSGISGKTSDLDEEDVTDASTAESSRRALVGVLGVERLDRLLAALYLVRQDGVSVIRQSSIQIWKALVNNTPRTVREILAELISQIITSGRTIAEICRKFGKKIVGEIMTILKGKATSTDSRTREGVCLVLSENSMENSTDTQREDHEDDIISMVRVSLVDDEANVRSAAAKVFGMFQEHIDETIHTLLEALRQPGECFGTALQALKEVMDVRAATVFPVLILALTAAPMTVFNGHALASLVTVAGSALSKRLTTITSAFVKITEDETDEELLSAVEEAARAFFTSINDAEGLNTLMMVLLGWSHDTPKRRKSGYKFFSIFCEGTDLVMSLYRVDWIRQLISDLDDHYDDVYSSAVQTIDVFLKSVPKDTPKSLVAPLRRSIESTGHAPGRLVLGFSVPKAVVPLVPVIIVESYIQTIASLVAALAIFPDELQPVVESYLVAGTPASVISSHTLIAVVSPDEEGDSPTGKENLFQKLGLMRRVVQKVIESAGNEKPFIARPAREAREALRYIDDESLRGLL